MRISIDSIDDPRLTALTPVGGGECFATYTCKFDGKPAFVVDEGTLADFIGDDDADLLNQLVTVRVFETQSALDKYVGCRSNLPGKFAMFST